MPMEGSSGQRKKSPTNATANAQGFSVQLCVAVPLCNILVGPFLRLPIAASRSIDLAGRETCIVRGKLNVN
jgi:hypothetical protein